MVGKEPSSVSAHPAELRVLLSRITPAAANVSPGRWYNVRSLLFAALHCAGIPTAPGKYRHSLAPVWEALRSLLADQYSRAKLSRFMSYCTANAISPGEVTTEVFARFAATLDSSMMRDPGGVHRDSCKEWNKASVTIADWPKQIVDVPDRRREFAYKLADFAPPFQEDLARFLSMRENSDIFSDDYVKPVKPLTSKMRKQHVLMAASALLDSGFPIGDITGLDVLVEIKNVRTALYLLHKRAESKKTGYVHHIATTLKTIAIHHVGTSPEEEKALKMLCRSLSPKRGGLTDKNRRFLYQLDSQRLAALLSLPMQLMRSADTQIGQSKTAAVRAAYAVAIAIELIVPLRARNLAGLRLDQFMRSGDHWILMIPAEETKNGNPIVAELPSWLSAFIDHYLENYRPRLLPGQSPWLLPGEGGGKRNEGGFGAQLSQFIAKEIGVTMTLHQFRHLAAKLYLDQNPQGFEHVRIVLGHRDIKTTMTFYREFDAILARRQYGELVTKLMEELGGTSSSKGRRK